MNPLVKLFHIVQWTFVTFLLTFPLLMVKASSLVELSWGWAFAPVGLLFLGIVIVPLALLFNADMKNFPLYGNREEGCPEWWLKMDKPAIKDIFPRWWWFVVRNPVNNMRFLFDDSSPFSTLGWQPQSMEAHDLIAAGVTSASYWRYRGAMAGYRRVWLNKDGKYSEFWFGWKVGSTVPGLGFATSLRLKRKIGT